MKYFVSHAATDSKVGSSPGWHACLFLSKWDDEIGGEVELVDNYGFYGVPATHEDPSWLGKIIRMAREDFIDWQGNHGWLKHEHCRELDRGYGVHALTYELTETEFLDIQGICIKEMEDQETATKQIAERNDFKPMGKKHRFYCHEDRSDIIFKIELANAKDEKRPPRLAPFDLEFTWTGFGDSHTCERHIYDILTRVLGEDKTSSLTKSKVPRFSGPREDVFLFSTGPLSTHTKRSGEKVYFRDQEAQDGVHLYWTLPPQLIVTDSAETRAQFLLDEQYVSMIKPIIRKLQGLEWFFLNQSFSDELEEYRASLIERIHNYYEAFAVVPARKDNEISKEKNSLSSYLMHSLFLAPLDKQENDLQQNIKKSKEFLSMIYSAVVDGCQFDFDDLKARVNVDDWDDDELGSLVSCLSSEKQKQLCKILGRSYLEADEQTLTQLMRF